jgi:hypothetical protein
MESGRISPPSGHSDHDNGVGGSNAPMIGFTSASNLSNVLTSFASASALLRRPVSPTRRSSPSPQQSQNLDDPTHTDGRPDSFDCPGNDANVNPLAMFTSFGKKKDQFQLSAAALKAAEERAKRWEAEDDSFLAIPPDSPSDKHTDVEIPHRQALLPVENLSQRSTVTGQTVSETAKAPSVNQQVGFSSASRVESGGTFRSGAHFSTPSALGNTSFQMPSVSNIKGKASLKPFKSPLISRPAVRTPGNRQILPSLLNPATSTPARQSRPAMLDSFARPVVVPTPEARVHDAYTQQQYPNTEDTYSKVCHSFQARNAPGRTRARTTQGH